MAVSKNWMWAVYDKYSHCRGFTSMELRISKQRMCKVVFFNFQDNTQLSLEWQSQHKQKCMTNHGEHYIKQTD